MCAHVDVLHRSMLDSQPQAHSRHVSAAGLSMGDGVQFRALQPAPLLPPAQPDSASCAPGSAPETATATTTATTTTTTAAGATGDIKDVAAADRRSLLAWRRYLQSAATAEDIAISWRMFTSIAAHAALQAVVRGIHLEELLDPAVVQSGPLVSASQLCRFLCSRLENVSWRVWYEMKSNAKRSGAAAKSNDSPPAQQSLPNNDNISTKISTMSRLSGPPRSYATTRGGSLKRSNSEPNLMAMPLPAKQQQSRVKEWLAGSLADALKDGTSTTLNLRDYYVNHNQLHHHHPAPQTVPLQQSQLAPLSTGSLGDDCNQSLYSMTLSTSTMTGSSQSCSTADYQQISAQTAALFSKCRMFAPLSKRSMLSQLLNACPVAGAYAVPTPRIPATAQQIPTAGEVAESGDVSTRIDAAAAKRRSLKQQQQHRQDQQQNSQQHRQAQRSTSATLQSTSHGRAAPFLLPYCPGTPEPQTSSVLVMTGSAATIADDINTSTSPAAHHSEHVLDRVHCSSSSGSKNNRTTPTRCSRSNSTGSAQPMSQLLSRNESAASRAGSASLSSPAPSSLHTRNTTTEQRQRTATASASMSSTDVGDMKRYFDENLAIW